MILNDAVRMYDKGQDLYIGGAEAFFFIGNRDEYERDIDIISETLLRKMIENWSRHKSYANHYKATDQKDKAHYMSSLAARNKAAIDEFRPLREASVSRVYDKDPKAGPGTVILIETTARGKYWFKKEYEEARKHWR